MCLARDRNDRNPLHLAIIYDELEVLQVLINVGFQAVHHHMCLARDRDGRNLYILLFEVALEKAEHGGTILHLCVKYNQLEALKILVNKLKTGEFVNAQDEDGMTPGHILWSKRVIVKAITYAISLVTVGPKDTSGQLSDARLLVKGHIGLSTLNSHERLRALEGKDVRSFQEWVKKFKDAIMVVASLITIMAFQAGISPPGGVWQDDLKEEPNLAR
ncbi:hypothetical protein ACH5RR_039621 [Cinchona calisaya]|uniref:PGG domain-containing protein n=1 Tax=Cinchona calisaya TaxID=153742 RepID=A0ABD2Y039_9GENT